MTSGRDGFALVFSILLIMAMAVLSAGMLAIAEQEARISGSAGHLLSARVRAESEVRRTIGTWSTARHSLLPVGASVGEPPDPASRSEVTVHRLAADMFLVEAAAVEGRSGMQVSAAAAALVRTIDVGALKAAALGAAAVVDTAELRGGRVSGVDACGSGTDGGLALVGDLAVQVGGELIDGSPATAPPPGSLPPLPYAEMSAARPAGAGAPRLIHAPGSLALESGEGRGLLVVDGDLAISDGFAFAGLILVAGRLLMDGGEIRGGVRAGTLELRNGLIQYDSCLLSGAFDAPGFDRAFRPPGRWWVPVF